MEMKEGIKKLEELKKKASLGGGRERIEKLRQEGYLLAEERLNFFLDPGTLWSSALWPVRSRRSSAPPPAYVPRDGVITGFGQVNGRTVGVLCPRQDRPGRIIGQCPGGQDREPHPAGLRTEGPGGCPAGFRGGPDPGREQEYGF